MALYLSTGSDAESISSTVRIEGVWALLNKALSQFDLILSFPAAACLSSLDVK